MCSETSEAVGTTWEHAQLEFQKFLKIRIPLPTVMMRINQKLSPYAFLGIATNKQSRVPTVLRFTDSRGESWCLIFAKEMRLSNVLFENDACFNPHLLT